MPVSGACHCGSIRFTAQIDPTRVLLCHCADCQTLSGSAFRANVPATLESFKLTGTKPREYLKTAASGAKRLHAFCPDCGTPLYSCATENATRVFLRLGAIHQRAMLRPALQIWQRSAAPWLDNLVKLPGSPEQQALDVL
ncbi:MAG: GFA family protein [Burkholderiaceae bacterium]|nr:GFA family protein [Burkholderiaceae bacterium]MCF8184976.1 GFA family protein [Polynucleobacter sp.]